MEKSLAQNTREAYWNTMSENQDTFDGVAKETYVAKQRHT